MDFKIMELISAGGDLSTIAILFIFVKHHTRLTVLETQLKMILDKIKLSAT